MEAVSTAVREVVLRLGVGALRIDDLADADLHGLLAWAGGHPHVESVREQLRRAEQGHVDYLAARAPDGTCVGKAGVDYEAEPDVGTIWQVAVHPGVQSLGIGTALIAEAERCIRRRGLDRAGLSVEVENVRARALYERLGYVADGRRASGWWHEGPGGTPAWHVAHLVDLHKPL